MKAMFQPTPDTAAFFDTIDRGIFALPQCAACQAVFLYPRSVCPTCMSGDIGLVEAGGRGVVESFVVNHRAAPGFEEDGHYVLALIRLEEGPIMMANVLTDDPDSVTVDAPVVVTFESRGDRQIVQFTLTEGKS